MKLIGCISIILTLLPWETSLCQEKPKALDAAPQIGGTRALSMGGVYIATSRGVEAISGNPGGIARIKGIEISLQGSAQLFRKSDVEEEYYQQILSFCRHSTRYQRTYQLRSIGIAFPISIPNTSIRLAGAIGYHSFYSWDSKRIVDQERVDRKGNIIKRKEEDEIRGLMDLFSLGIGVAISNMCSFGISINFPAHRRYNIDTSYEYIRPDGTYQYQHREEWGVTADNFLQLGGILQVTPRLAVGVSCLMSHGFIIRDGKIEDNHNGQISSHQLDHKNKWEIPTVIDFGISYRLKPELLVAADIQSRPWENIRINGLPIDRVKNGNAYRFGLEYGQKILLRAGFALDRLPLLDAEDRPVDIKDLTAGIGCQFKYLILDLGASYKFTTFDRKIFHKRWDYFIREFTIYATFKYGYR